jgi:CRP/FNR family cyclic AMP-dependent transcriptional regulator
MILQEAELFKGIDPEVMNKIVNICSEQNYPQNSVLFKMGEEAEFLYILGEGIVNLVIENGGKITFTLEESGEVFGWSSLVESGHYTASAVCATKVKALKIERDELNKIFNLHPNVGLKVLKRLGDVISRRLTGAYRDLLSARGQGTAASYG